MDEDTLPNFDGKIVVLYLSNAPRSIQDGVLLEFASFKMQGGRLFIVGRIPAIEEGTGDWIANMQGAVAWDSVNHYIIFESREDYIKRIKEAKVPILQRIFKGS